MKILALVVIFLLLALAPIGFAKTKTVILDRGDSYVFEDVNITMIDFNKKRDKVLVCVDNERAIISEEKRVGWVYFEIKSFRDDGVKMVLDADCDDCVVSDNSECFPVKTAANYTEDSFEEKTLDELDEFEDVNETVNETLQNETVQNRTKEVEERKTYNGVFKRILFSVVGVFR